jgi:predicted porin
VGGYAALGAAGALLHDRDDTGAISANDILLGGTGGAPGNAAPVFFPGFGTGALVDALDYDQAVSGFDNKLTYLSPVFNGFQAGVSYTPELTGVSQELEGHNQDDQFDDYGDIFDLAARWEGMFNNVGITLGGGYSHASHEDDDAAENANGAYFVRDVTGNGVTADDENIGFVGDREAWNVGLDLNWGAFGLGGAYTNDDLGVSDDALERETWVVGADYTTGPFKLGASYLNQDQSFATAELETERWTGGVVYTYGPGMTFRGSVSYVDFNDNLGDEGVNNADKEDVDAVGFLLGTQIDF